MGEGEEVRDRPAAAGSGPVLAHELGGDLPCARCRYNLKGLSIRGVCPECGTPIRATLLAVVDPMAGELRPIHHPVFTAWGVVIWGTAPFLAALLVWSMRLMGPGWGVRGSNLPEKLVVVLSVLSGLGALALVRPHDGERAAKGGRLALVGAVLYGVLAPLLWYLHARIDQAGLVGNGEARLAARVCIGAVMMVIIALLRPNARLLAARSLLMRAGRVDRQTLLALVGVVSIGMAGDLMRLASLHAPGGPGQLLDQVGQALVLISSVLLTIGLLGVLVDCWRMFPVIIEAPLSLSQLLHEPRPAAAQGQRS